MKITSLGLSSFLLENKFGSKILIDPFSDHAEYFLGIKFLLKIKGKPIASNLTLLSNLDS